MKSDAHTEITSLLHRWSGGDPQAAERVLALVYDELRRVAAGYARRERRHHTLQPTALVHEAYLQLFGPIQENRLQFHDRAHFLAVAARVMRRLLIDHSRERGAWKRGGRVEHLPLAVDLAAVSSRSAHLEALDEALDGLERLDPEAARVVELRYFGGLTLEETAACLGLSRKTVVRQWRRARAWLYAELGGAAYGC